MVTPVDPAVPCRAVLCHAVLCCPRPVPEAPKADPLGRNLNGATQQMLPPGYVDAAEAAAEKARQGEGAQQVCICRLVLTVPMGHLCVGGVGSSCPSSWDGHEGE
jgi:hypothetical protein